MIKASIDIGSNSILLLVLELDQNGEIVKEHLNESRITSLGKELDKNKKFLEETMNATFEALTEYASLLKKIKIEAGSVLVAATEASRVAENASNFFSKIKNEIGFNIRVISGNEEAELTALGVSYKNSDDAKQIVIMDIGGASTELILLDANPFKIIKSVSYPIGSVRATDYLANGSFENKMHQLLEHFPQEFKTSQVICVAGAMTSLATMFLGAQEFSDKKIEGLTIKYSSYLEFNQALQKTNLENLNLLFPFLGKRLPMVKGGALVVNEFCVKMNVETMKVSTRGLRYGIIFKEYLNGNR